MGVGEAGLAQPGLSPRRKRDGPDRPSFHMKNTLTHSQAGHDCSGVGLAHPLGLWGSYCKSTPEQSCPALCTQGTRETRLLWSESEGDFEVEEEVF